MLVARLGIEHQCKMSGSEDGLITSSLLIHLDFSEQDRDAILEPGLYSVVGQSMNMLIP